MTAASLPALAITGATGHVGGRVARDLAAAGAHLRLLVRNPARAPQIDNATVVRCSYDEKVTATQALEDVSTVFMVSGSESADRVDQHRTFIDAAAESGVRHLVYTSFYGAAPDCTFTLGRDHWATEEHIKASGLDYTFLRDNFYLDVLPEFVGDDGVLRGPAGDGRVAAVARADVARVATAILQEPAEHRNAGYDLTGPEAITLSEAADTISTITGRRVSFHNETIDEAYASRRRWPAPDWQYDAWVSTYTAIANDDLSVVTDDVRRLTGRAPMSLADLLTDRTR